MCFLSDGIQTMQKLMPLIARAIQPSDDLVVVFDYLDAKGIASRRIVSPYQLCDAGDVRRTMRSLHLTVSRTIYLRRISNR